MLSQIFLQNNKHSCIVLLAIWAYHKQWGEFNHTWYLFLVDPVHSSRCWLKCGNSSAVLKWKDPKLVFFLDAFLWSWDSSFYQDTHNISFNLLKSYNRVVDPGEGPGGPIPPIFRPNWIFSNSTIISTLYSGFCMFLESPWMSCNK